MFTTLTLLPSDPIYGMQALYKTDVRPAKINLSIGICLDERGKLLRFKAQDEAEKRLFQKKPSKEYLPITGLAEYCEKAQKLILGNCPKEELFSTQTVGGTGALFVAAKLLRAAQTKQVFIPDPSWPNHRQLFEAAGFTVTSYPYYNPKSVSLDFDKMKDAISQMPEGAIIILQASCHNPTGIDPTLAEWQELSPLIKKRRLLPFFDLAYFGLGSGPTGDLQGIDLFLKDDHEMFVATTFAKSMGLYNDRAALLSIRSRKSSLDTIASHVRSIIRTTYSSPPANGALIANEILGDDALRNMWLEELEATRLRLEEQKKMLYNALLKAGAQIAFKHLLYTKGLFCLLDLTSEQIATLRSRDGIYIALDGRISLAAITQDNVEHIAQSLARL